MCVIIQEFSWFKIQLNPYDNRRQKNDQKCKTYIAGIELIDPWEMYVAVILN